MTMAWEVTHDDVRTVLGRHGIRMSDYEIDELDVDADRVVSAVLHYTEFEDQCNAALSEIEDILLEDGVISGPKQFTVAN